MSLRTHHLGSAFVGQNQRDVRIHNVATVLTLIREHGPLSRTEIAKRTGLTKASVSNLMRDFEDVGLIVPAGIGASTNGPKPRLVQLRDGYRYAVGVDLSDRHFSAGLVDLSRRTMEGVREHRVRPDAGPFLDQVCQAVDPLIAEARAGDRPLMGIGIAISGLVDHGCGVVHRSTVFGVESLPLQAELEGRYGLPVRIDGDVNVRLRSEMRRQPPDWLDKTVVYVYVGTGVGASLFTAGQIYRGASGFTGEVGHIPVAEGPRCACGLLGCLEMVATWPALVYHWGKLAPSAAVDETAAGAADADDALTSETVVRLAQAGNPYATKACQQLAHYLGKGLAMLTNILNPHAIWVGGPMARYPDLFTAPLRESLHHHALTPLAQQTELRFAPTNPRAVVTEAAELLTPLLVAEAVDAVRNGHEG